MGWKVDRERKRRGWRCGQNRDREERERMAGRDGHTQMQTYSRRHTNVQTHRHKTMIPCVAFTDVFGKVLLASTDEGRHGIRERG